MWEIITVAFVLVLSVIIALVKENNKHKNNQEACRDYIRKNPNIYKAELIFYNELLNHSDKYYACPKCQNELMQLWNLKDDNIEYRCKECKKKFKFVPSKEHLDNLHAKANNLYTLLNKLSSHTNKHGHMFGWEGLKQGLTFNYFQLNRNTPYIRAIHFEAKGSPPQKKQKRSRRISQKVKDLVWNRDNGRCAECGSNEKLEFDHIIPHAKGGSNTYRNIQLLCEPCNRSKHARIG